MASLNSPHAPLQYRIGETDRVIGGPCPNNPDGFSVLNLTNGKVFVAHAGVWTDGGTMPLPTSPFDFPALLAQWYATNSTNLNTANMLPELLKDTSGNVVGGAGYRIGSSERSIGATTSAPNGFIVLNQRTGNTFVAQGGVWTAGGTFPSDLMTAWLEA